MQHYLGLFDVEEDAARAYDTHARVSSTALTNFSIYIHIAMNCQATFGAKAKTNFVYDPEEPIPHADTALAPAKSLLVTRPPPLPPPPTPDPEKVSVKGSHPRRTYVGIKARRKRLSGAMDSGNETGTSMSGIESGESDKNIVNDDNAKKIARFRPPSATLDPKWRDKIQYLRGEISFGNSQNATSDGTSKNFSHICLKGKWKNSLYGKPDREHIMNWANKNDFYYESLSKEDISTLSSVNGELLPYSGNYTGFHVAVIQTEDGKEKTVKCTETVLQLLFGLRSQDNNPYQWFVVGRGESDLGKILLSGHYNSRTKEIEMSKQFVEDADTCNQVSLKYLLDNFKTSGGGLASSQHEDSSSSRSGLQATSNVAYGMARNSTADSIGNSNSGNY